MAEIPGYRGGILEAQVNVSAEVRETQEALAAAYAGVFTSAAGQMVLAHWETIYGSRISFMPNDPYTSAYQEGQRSVLLGVKKLLQQVQEQNTS